MSSSIEKEIVENGYTINRIIEKDKQFKVTNKSQEEKVVLAFKTTNSKILNFYQKVSHFDHPNCEKIEFFRTKSNRLYVVKDYFPMNNFTSRLSSNNNSSYREDQIIVWLYDLLSALKCYHDNNLVHKCIDLKHFGLKNDEIYLLSDPKTVSPILKCSFNCPEYGTTQQITTKYDIWCLGWCVYNLATFLNPYQDFEKIGYLHVWKEKPNLPTHFQKLNKIFNQMTALDPENRPSCDELLSNSFFEKFKNSDSDKLFKNKYRILQKKSGYWIVVDEKQSNAEVQTELIVKKILKSDTVKIRGYDFLKYSRGLGLNSVYDIFRDDKFYYIVQPKYQSFKEKIMNIESSKIELDDNRIHIWLYECLRTLEHLHSNGIIHKKISIDSIIFEDEKHLKLDFNPNSSFLSSTQNSIMVNPSDVSYNSPELVKDPKSITKKYDIWCLGWTFYGMCWFRDYGEHLSTINFSEQDVCLEFPEFMKDEDLKMFLSRMMNLDPDKRPSANEIIESSIFDDFRAINQKGYSIIGIFNFKDFYKCTQNFTVSNNNFKIGGKNIQNLKAIKCLEELDRTKLLNELQNLKNINHENVLKYYEIFTNEKMTKFFLVQDYYPNKTLHEIIFKFMEKSKVIHKQIIYNWITQIAKGADHLLNLKNPIIYLNLNPQNIVLHNEVIKLTNNFSQTLHNEKFDELNGDDMYELSYMSPEAIQKEYHPNSNSWSIGCILYELLKFKRAYSQNTLDDLMIAIKNLNPPEIISEDKLDYIYKKIMVKDYNQRYTCGKIAEQFAYLISDMKFNDEVSNEIIKKTDDRSMSLFICNYIFGSKYKFKSFLKKGGFGQVFLVEDIDTEIKYALKKLNDNGESTKLISIFREANILKKLNHPNIIKIHDFFQDDFDGVFKLVLEFCNHDNLREMIKIQNSTNEKLSLDDINKWFYQLMNAIEYLHSIKVLHKDIKPENILFHKNYKGVVTLKLADFGLSRFQENNQDFEITTGGTLTYMSPELLNRESLCFKTDVWSAGCVLYELVHLKRMFPGESAEKTIKILSGDYPKLDYNPILDSIHEEMTKRNPVDRASASEVLTKLMFNPK